MKHVDITRLKMVTSKIYTTLCCQSLEGPAAFSEV
jgi:hypothetical protein